MYRRLASWLRCRTRADTTYRRPASWTSGAASSDCRGRCRTSSKARRCRRSRSGGGARRDRAETMYRDPASGSLCTAVAHFRCVVIDACERVADTAAVFQVAPGVLKRRRDSTHRGAHAIAARRQIFVRRARSWWARETVFGEILAIQGRKVVHSPQSPVPAIPRWFQLLQGNSSLDTYTRSQHDASRDDEGQARTVRGAQYACPRHYCSVVPWKCLISHI